MKDITKFIIEKLKLSKDTKSNSTGFEPSDPDGFEVGDILVSRWSYSSSFVNFWKIIKKIGKATFECAEVPEKITSGNSMQGKSQPDVEKYNEKSAKREKFRVKKDGKLRENGGGYSAMIKWDGESSYNFDHMD